MNYCQSFRRPHKHKCPSRKRRDEQRRTQFCLNKCLDDACRFGNAEEVRRLLLLGANPNGSKHHSPVGVLQDQYADDILPILFEFGLDVKADTNASLLYNKVFSGDSKVFRGLLEAGADVRANASITLFTIATCGLVEFVQILKETGFKPSKEEKQWLISLSSDRNREDLVQAFQEL